MKTIRGISINRILIVLLVLAFVSGYFLRQDSGSSGISTVTTVNIQTRVNTTTRTVFATGSTYISNTSSTSIGIPQNTQSSTANSTTSTSTILQSSSSSVYSTTSVTTNTSYSYQIYSISQSYLLSSLGLNGTTGIELTQSTSLVPYYVVTDNATQKVIGLMYLDSDVDSQDCYGYSSLIQVLVLVNTTGTIKAISMYSDLDIYGYMFNQAYLNTYINRSVLEDLSREGVFGITGATITSTAIMEGVSGAGQMVVQDYQQQSPASPVAGKKGTIASLSNMGTVVRNNLLSMKVLAAISMIVLTTVSAMGIGLELKTKRNRYITLRRFLSAFRS